MGESKSPALPLGDAPIALNGLRRGRPGPFRAVRVGRWRADVLDGSHAPHRFTVAAQVLEHFPSKWKPGFRWQNAAKHNPFIVIGRHGAGYRDRAPNDKTTGHGSARERHFPRRKAATGQLKSACAAVESRSFSWEDRGRQAGRTRPAGARKTDYLTTSCRRSSRPGQWP